MNISSVLSFYQNMTAYNRFISVYVVFYTTTLKLELSDLFIILKVGLAIGVAYLTRKKGSEKVVNTNIKTKREKNTTDNSIGKRIHYLKSDILDLWMRIKMWFVRYHTPEHVRSSEMSVHPTILRSELTDSRLSEFILGETKIEFVRYE